MRNAHAGSLASAIGFAAFSIGNPAHAQQGMPPATVRVVTVVQQRLAPTITVPGTVLSRDDARLSAETDGRIIDIAEIGTTARKGEPVAQIDDELLRLQREEYTGLVARDESRVAFLEREVQRLSKLAQANNAAKSQLDQTESELQVARNDLVVARARLQQIETQLQRAVIRAPFAGQVTERFLTPGERVTVGDTVLRIIGHERLEVVSRAPLRTIKYLAEGSRVRLHGDSGAGGGTVRTIVPYGDSSSHMYELRVEVPAADWLVAETVRVIVPLAAPEEVLAVPRDALVLRREGTSVYRINAEQLAERITVTTGFTDGELVAVEGSLSAGDRVVVRGAERLQPGQQVSVIQDDSAQVAGRESGTPASP